MYKPYESTRNQTNDWITPRYVLDSLGQFDLDPCSSLTQPWPTATTQWTVEDDGLSHEWQGRVWLNPPYSNSQIVKWIERLAEHGNGIALVYVRSETQWWQRWVFGRASSILFLAGRVYFHRPDGTPSHASTAPSALIAYGTNNTEALATCGLKGALVKEDNWTSPKSNKKN